MLNRFFIEEHVKSLGVDCVGKDVLPAYGEMTPDVIRKSIFKDNFKHEDVEADLVIPRPPTFCAGCPHRGLFYELGKRKDIVITGDIGCWDEEGNVVILSRRDDMIKIAGHRLTTGRMEEVIMKVII